MIDLYIILTIVACVWIIRLAIYFLKIVSVKPIRPLALSEIIAKTPEVKKYTDNGYDLLTVILESQGNCLEPVKFSVYNYDDQGYRDPFPIFRIDYDSPSKFYGEENQTSNTNYA